MPSKIFARWHPLERTEAASKAVTVKSQGVSGILELRESPRKGERACSCKKPSWAQALHKMGLRKTAVQMTLLFVLATSISLAKGMSLHSHG